MNQTMSDDIPQDQVEAVARDVLTVIRANTVTFNDVGLSITIAIAAIRVLTPMIAAVERERCAVLCDAATDPRSDSEYSAGAADMAYELAESIRSVKGAVT